MGHIEQRSHYLRDAVAELRAAFALDERGGVGSSFSIL